MRAFMDLVSVRNLGMGVGLAGLLGAGSASAVIVTDTFSRTGTATWGAVDNGSVGGEVGTVAASYTLDGGVNVSGTAGLVNNNRVVLDYNLADDASVQTNGGFVVEWQVNPGDGDDANGESGLGREFAGIALTDSNANPPYGGAGAITNVNNETIRYAVLPRNSGSAGKLTRTAGNVRTLNATGDPNNGGFNEEVFDQTTFDAYVNAGTPDPFANSVFYDVRIEVLGDFSPMSSVIVNTTVNGIALTTETIEWGSTDDVFVSAVAFNGPHQYDNLKITAVPEPASLALLSLGGLAMLRRRK